jgi:uracil-DNA glycosylase family 4
LVIVLVATPGYTRRLALAVGAKLRASRLNESWSSAVAEGKREVDLATIGDRQAALALVQQEIAACTRCVEGGFIPAALPIFHGHAGQRLMIVGQAPGPTAGERPLPYTGATGRALQAWLERAGFPPGAIHHEFYLTSLTKCFPGQARGAGAKGDRPPSAREIALCASHLDREIALVRPRIIVSLGRLAAERLDPTARGLALADIVGSVRPAARAGHSFRLVPLPHPSGVSRWLNQPAHRARLEQALARLTQEVEEAAGWQAAYPLSQARSV